MPRSRRSGGTLIFRLEEKNWYGRGMRHLQPPLGSSRPSYAAQESVVLPHPLEPSRTDIALGTERDGQSRRSYHLHLAEGLDEAFRSPRSQRSHPSPAWTRGQSSARQRSAWGSGGHSELSYDSSPDVKSKASGRCKERFSRAGLRSFSRLPTTSATNGARRTLNPSSPSHRVGQLTTSGAAETACLQGGVSSNPMPRGDGMQSFALSAYRLRAGRRGRHGRASCSVVALGSTWPAPRTRRWWRRQKRKATRRLRRRHQRDAHQIKRFMEVYPKIKATFVTAGGWQLYNRYMSEHSAGQAVADAFTNVEDTLLTLDAGGGSRRFNPPRVKNFPTGIQVGNFVRTKLGYAALVVQHFADEGAAGAGRLDELLDAAQGLGGPRGLRGPARIVGGLHGAGGDAIRRLARRAARSIDQA